MHRSSLLKWWNHHVWKPHKSKPLQTSKFIAPVLYCGDDQRLLFAVVCWVIVLFWLFDGGSIIAVETPSLLTSMPTTRRADGTKHAPPELFSSSFFLSPFSPSPYPFSLFLFLFVCSTYSFLFISALQPVLCMLSGHDGRSLWSIRSL